MEDDAPHVSATVPDWSRERLLGFWHPSCRLLAAIRGYQAAIRRGGVLGSFQRYWWSISHRFWSALSQSDIPAATRIGGGLLMPHPNGIVIHDRAILGANCLLFQQVTLGVRDGLDGAPIIGGHVDIGAGAKVLGPVTIGDHARIGANAVVLDDVPSYAVAVGVPARVLSSERTARSADP